MKVLIALLVTVAIQAATAQQCSQARHSSMWPDNDGQHFFRCVQQQGQWRPKRMCCPSGQVFNRCRMVCVVRWNCNWHCCGPIGTTTAEPSTTTPVTPSSTTASPGKCAAPRCTADELETLWPSTSPSSYYQCTALNAVPRVIRCEGATLFNWFQQTCVQPASWVDGCGARTYDE